MKKKNTHCPNAFPRNPEYRVNLAFRNPSKDLPTKTPDRSDSATSSQLDCSDLFPAVNCMTIFSWNKNEKIAAESWRVCNGNFSYNGMNGCLTAATSFSNIWESVLREMSYMWGSVKFS